ncbi:MAG: hypothetical protein ACFFCM_14485, partial [Promethearchaeota archaeon]
YVSTKSEILIYIVKYYFSREDFIKTDECIQRFLLTIDIEPNILARSKMINEAIKLLIEPANFGNIKQFDRIINVLLEKIESPYYKMESWLNKLTFMPNMRIRKSY